MRALVLETSTERGVVAIIDDQAIVFEIQLPFGLQNSHYLLPTLQQELQLRGISLKDLSHIVVGIGPGSYTGIRVGAMVAKTLAFACHLPLIGVCTLSAFVPDQNGSFAAVIDAKIGGVYIQKGIKLDDGMIKITTEPQVFVLTEAAAVLQDVETIVTPNAEKIRPKLEALLPQNTWRWHECYPSCERLAQIAQEKMLQGMEPRLELMYLRKTQAEIERENSK